MFRKVRQHVEDRGVFQTDGAARKEEWGILRSKTACRGQRVLSHRRNRTQRRVGLFKRVRTEGFIPAWLHGMLEGNLHMVSLCNTLTLQHILYWVSAAHSLCNTFLGETLQHTHSATHSLCTGETLQHIHSATHSLLGPCNTLTLQHVPW